MGQKHFFWSEHIFRRELGEKIKILNFTLDYEYFRQNNFHSFSHSGQFQWFSPLQSLCSRSTPTLYLLFSFCQKNLVWYFSEPRLRRSNCYKALYMLATPPFFVFFRDSNDFHPRKASVGEAHLPNLYALLRFCTENRAQYFYKPGFMQSKCYKATFILRKSSILFFLLSLQ